MMLVLDSESAVRGRLRRKGYALSKSRVRDRRSPTFGRYHIYDPSQNIVIWGIGAYTHELDLDEVIAIERDIVA